MLFGSGRSGGVSPLARRWSACCARWYCPRCWHCVRPAAGLSGVVVAPLFAADALGAYFATFSVRLRRDAEKQLARPHLFWVLTVLSLKFVFEMLLYEKVGQ
nr:transmembrane protein 203-like [Dasypus novemcinctus]